jgi:hypothetical protein
MSAGFRLYQISARQVDAVRRVKLKDFLRRRLREAKGLLRRLPREGKPLLRGPLREGETLLRSLPRGETLRGQIDALGDVLYALTPAEIQIVEGGSAKINK